MHTSNHGSVLPTGRRTMSAVLASLIAVGLLLTPNLATSASASPVPEGAPTTTPVTAAKPVKKAASVKLSANKKSYLKGKTGAKVTTKVSASGKKVAGTVKFYAGKKKLRSAKLSKGNASYTLPKNLTAKKHTITVRFAPTGTAKKTIKTASAKIKVNVVDPGKKVAKVAKKYIGVKYRYGGKTPKGFDCSGFTSYVYQKAGIKKLPTNSSAQRHAGKVVSRSKAKVGDLIWTPGHVAIYLGGNKQIDAPRPGKTIQVRTIWQSNPKFIRV